MNIQTGHDFTTARQNFTDGNVGSLTIKFHKLTNLSDKLIALSDDLIDDADEEMVEQLRSAIRCRIYEISRSMAQQKGSSANEECARVNVMLRYFANEGIDPCEAPDLVEALDRYASRFNPRGKAE